ncbi:MAG: putative extracellular nuclease [Verrucomicrobiales bacterium]|jgi:predicted extracellular nuclease
MPRLLGVSFALSFLLFGLNACAMKKPPSVDSIGSLKGAPQLTPDGVEHKILTNGQVITFQGVIYQISMWEALTSGVHYGFLVQNTAEQSDGDPATSDGLFIYCGNTLSLELGSGQYRPKPGDHVILKGTMKNRYGQAEISKPEVIRVVKTGLDLDVVLPAEELKPPSDTDEATLYYEQREGMRCSLPAGTLVVGKRQVYRRTTDATCFVIRGDHPVALREAPLERRLMRDYHPLDDLPEQVFDNGNGFRICLSSMGLKAAADDTHVYLPPVKTFDVFEDGFAGGLTFSYGNMQLLVDEMPRVKSGPSPIELSPALPPQAAGEFSIATYNVENLYDARNDPFDGCDFITDAGCPGVTGSPDYAPSDAAVYEARLAEMAEQIVAHMQAPDIVLIQEAEDQDICLLVDGVLTETKANHADGKPDTLQELCLAIAAQGGPAYDCANDRDGADTRGIITGFLYRKDRVELLPVTSEHPILGNAPDIQFPFDSVSTINDVQNPKAFNAFYHGPLDKDDILNVTYSRAPQVGWFRIWAEEVGKGKQAEVYLINNHFSSRPDSRIVRRTYQARYNASLTTAINAAFPEALVIAGGDLNVFPRPDDPVGDPFSDQLGPLYDAGLWNVNDLFLEKMPRGSYTYVYRGEAGTLDHLFLNPAMKARMTDATLLHINSDWPEEFDGDRPMGITDHDPIVSRFSF